MERNGRGKLLKADSLSSEFEGNYQTREVLGSISRYLVKLRVYFYHVLKLYFYLRFYVCTWVSLCVAHLLKEASRYQTPWNYKLPSTGVWPEIRTQFCYQALSILDHRAVCAAPFLPFTYVLKNLFLNLVCFKF